MATRYRRLTMECEEMNTGDYEGILSACIGIDKKSVHLLCKFDLTRMKASRDINKEAFHTFLSCVLLSNDNNKLSMEVLRLIGTFIFTKVWTVALKVEYNADYPYHQSSPKIFLKSDEDMLTKKALPEQITDAFPIQFAEHSPAITTWQLIWKIMHDIRLYHPRYILPGSEYPEETCPVCGVVYVETMNESSITSFRRMDSYCKLLRMHHSKSTAMNYYNNIMACVHYYDETAIEENRYIILVSDTLEDVTTPALFRSLFRYPLNPEKQYDIFITLTNTG